jgi:hypothetical protein
MDHNTFDDFARTIGGTSTRRRFSALLVGLGLGSVAGLGLLGADEAEAKNKQKRKRRRKRKRKNKGQAQDTPVDPPAEPPVEPPACVPDCTGPLGPKECGSDGCGGSCGTCPTLKPICASVTYTCEPII